MELHKMYRPVTAAPYKCTGDYMEFEPCDALKPYIRCFWGSPRVVTGSGNQVKKTEIVIPDTCMDIIFTADFTDNRIESLFCGIDDRTFVTESVGKAGKTCFVFAIRFYPWGVPMFAEESLRNTKNAFFDAGCHFSEIKKKIGSRLFDAADIYRFIPIAERILLEQFNDRHRNKTVFEAVSKILQSRGNIRMTDIEQEVLVGGRQLERLFLEYVGVSPKSLASMVRYQCLWREFLCQKNFNMMDAVYRYGYSDQAHLCHDFKKYHSMSLSDAGEYARQNVGNIQGGLPES